MTSKPSHAKPIRYAVVGLGHIAQIAVLPAFAHAKRNSRLQAIVSGDPVKLAEVGDKYDVPVRVSYDDFEECLRDVDAVYICTPNTEHASFAVRAAHAGVHVLCEKPLAADNEQCDEILIACREAGVKLMTAYRLHLEPLTLEVIDLVRNGAIGQPRFFSSSFSMTAIPGGIRTKDETGGGTVYDLGVYCINAARMLFGAEPTAVSAFSTPGGRSGLPEVDEMTSALLFFDGDRLASFTTSFGAADVSSYRIVGTKGDILVEPAYEYAEPLAYRLTVDGKVTRKRGRKRDQFAAELLYFSDCILKDQQPEPSGEEGVWEVRIANAIYQAAQLGDVVPLEPFSGEPQPARDQAISQPPVRKPELVHTKEVHK